MVVGPGEPIKTEAHSTDRCSFPPVGRLCRCQMIMHTGCRPAGAHDAGGRAWVRHPNHGMPALRCCQVRSSTCTPRRALPRAWSGCVGASDDT